MTVLSSSRRTGLVGLAALCLALLFAGLELRYERPAPQPNSDPDYLAWLEQRSMLYQARQVAHEVSGHGVQWRHPYGRPQPRQAVRHASVWLLDYPGSVVTRPGQSVIATWSDPHLWDVLRQTGIELLHTGPVNRAGGVEGRKYTPSLDGWFDRISLEIDPSLGSAKEYARMVAVARTHGCLIAGDLVPLHTGTGADFRLALRGFKDYPGMYTMVEIDHSDWGLLPAVQGEGLALLPRSAAEQLTRKGYLPGLINSNDAASGVRSWSGWSASGPVRGADGKVRRWVYLHYFKPTQPTLNWLDPSFAAQRAIGGDAVRTVYQRRTRVVRLDAVPFLGIEPRPGTTQTWHYQHPLSFSATNYLAFLIRKMGGWSFQELNVPLESLNSFTRNGPDLSYDFFTRAQCLHALLTGDAAPLRLAFRWLLEEQVQPLTLVHDLQNHDEITYQLVEPDHRKDRVFVLGGQKMTGKQLRQRMLEQMRSRVAGPAAPYNKLYRPEQDGVATTFAGFIAPALGVHDPYNATSEQVHLIRQGHLLLAAANALQPGVFSLSSWDVVGALPISAAAAKQRTTDGDYRWINRGGVDLMGANPNATESAYGLPRAKSLYGSLSEQMSDPESFVSRLRRMLAARKKARIAEGELFAVPEPHSSALCVLVLRLPEYPLAVTVLNFGRHDVDETIDLRGLREIAQKGLTGSWVDFQTGHPLATVAKTGTLQLRVPALSGTTWLLATKDEG
jgi:maltose alpha-D-glucosyltransferase/alpha-amylase